MNGAISIQIKVTLDNVIYSGFCVVSEEELKSFPASQRLELVEAAFKRAMLEALSSISKTKEL